MKIYESEFKVVIKEGKPFVVHKFNGTNFQDEDLMMIYGLKSRPYVKRLGKKIHLPEEIIEELKEVA